MNGHTISISILTIVVLIIFLQGSEGTTMASNINELQIPKTNTYTFHSVIRINNDTDFAVQAAKEGWTGNGSASNPYIISGYNIDAHGANNAIYVGNTTVHFIIENCYLQNTSYYYWSQVAGDIMVLYNVTNAIIRNTIIYNSENYGLDLIYTNNTIVYNTTINSSKNDGLYIFGSHSDIIENSTFENVSYWGLREMQSTNISIISNKFYNDIFISLGVYYSTNNTIKDNILFKKSIFLYGEEKTYTSQTIVNNTVNGKQIYYYNNINMNNTTTPSDAGEIILGNASYLNINNISVENISVVVEAGYSSNINVSNISAQFSMFPIVIVHSSDFSLNNMRFNTVGSSGVMIKNSKNNIIRNLTIQRSYYNGVVSYYSNNITISNSTLKNCYKDTIRIYRSYNETVINTTIINDSYGIGIHSSPNAYIYGNKLINASIYLDGEAKTFTTQTIENNTLNGKMIYYYKNSNLNNNTIPADAGEIILGNVSYLNIKNQSISNQAYGLEIGYSSHINIHNITSEHNTVYGLYLIESNNITIENSTLSHNEEYGIYAKNSDSILIINCSIGHNNAGIDFESTNNSRIIHNDIYQNYWYGIILDGWPGSNNNWIYNNSFYYNDGSGDRYSPNHIQVYDDSFTNHWNSTTGYGNYWHDWASNNSTNDQNHDGIVDWPYIITKYSGLINLEEDYYPLKNPTYSMPALTPTEPLNLTAKAGNGFVNLTWRPPLGNGSTPIIEYKIYRKSSLIATVPASQLWYRDTNVTAGINYTYYVTAVNSVGESTPSEDVSASPYNVVPEFNSSIIWCAIAIAFLAMMVQRKRK